MHRISSVLLVIALAVFASTPLPAQSAQAVSLQISGLYNVVFGNVFESVNLKNGLGGEAQIRYTPGALSIGAGFQYTEHDRPRVLPTDPPLVKARLYGAFIEPRYRIHTGSNVAAPYLSARFSLLKVGFSNPESSNPGFSLSSDFIQLNGGGGLLYRLGSRLNLDVGGTFGFNRLGRGTLRSSVNTAEVVGPSSGANLMLRIGFALGIGG